MWRRLSLRDFVIVPSLELEFDSGFGVLTGETGAGKSILVDALQLALGGRGDAMVVREGCPRAEISVEFDTPVGLKPWLEEAGFAADGELLLRRVIDAQGRSRAWINGSTATVAQLREAAEHLVEIHGQHAWQRLTQPPAVRALLDARARVERVPIAAAFGRWRSAVEALDAAVGRRAEIERERERLAWQIAEVDKLAPQADEWQTLDAEHQRLANARSLIDAARGAMDMLSDADDNASKLIQRAVDALDGVARYDDRLAPVLEVLRGAQAGVDDAAHSLTGYLHHIDIEPERLAALDQRIGAWLSLARRWRTPPAELPQLLDGWRAQLRALDAAVDVAGLTAAVEAARADYDRLARAASAARKGAAPTFASEVRDVLQMLGMQGGRFEIALESQAEPTSYGAESAEFLVAGHAGATPRPLAKVASGGELSRIALAIAVTAAQSGGADDADGPGTLIFDEIDAGIGGVVADTVGRLMKRLGRHRQVLAVTHLPQVAAAADHHFIVAKKTLAGATTSDVSPVAGEARVAEVARMLGSRESGRSLAHAEELLALAAAAETAPAAKKPRKARR